MHQKYPTSSKFERSGSLNQDRDKGRKYKYICTLDLDQTGHRIGALVTPLGLQLAEDQEHLISNSAGKYSGSLYQCLVLLE